MAISWTVKRVPTESASFNLTSSGSSAGGVLGRVDKSRMATYLVTASGPEVDADPSVVDAVMALQAPGVPTVGNTIYVNPATGRIWPYFTCQSVEAARDEVAPQLFEVTAEFSDNSGEEQEQDPPNDPEEIPSFLDFSVESIQLTAWTEGATGGGAPCILPTGTLFPDPILREESVLVIKLTQYENNFDEGDMADRAFTVNESKWRGYDPGEAKITDISWERNVKVPLALGVVINTQKVTYTIKCADYTILSMDENGDDKTLSPGWEPVRILADTRYLQEANKRSTLVEAYTGAFAGLTTVYLKPDGTPYPLDKQLTTTRAPQKVFKVHRRKNFASFLRL